MTQQGDVKLYQTDDGGEIEAANGIIEMTGGLGTAAYLSLFGGNEDDDGRSDSALAWWGNLSETVQDRKYVSETQNLLRAIPSSSANLRKVENAALRDLAWVKSSGVASYLAVSASIIGVNRVKISVIIEANGRESEVNFVENWKARL